MAADAMRRFRELHDQLKAQLSDLSQAEQEGEGGGDEVLETVRARVESLGVVRFAHELHSADTDAWATSARPRRRRRAGLAAAGKEEGRTLPDGLSGFSSVSFARRVVRPAPAADRPALRPRCQQGRG